MATPTVQFTQPSESVNISAGTFSIPVSFTGQPNNITGMTFGPSINGPQFMAFDGSGNLWVPDTNNNNVTVITPDGSTLSSVTLPGSTFGSASPYGIAFDGGSTMYIGDTSGTNNIYPVNTSTYTVGSGIPLIFDSIGDTPQGLAFFGGNLYASGEDDNFPGDNNGIYQITIPGETVTQYAYPFNNPYGIVFDPSGNLYVADQGENDIFQVPPGGTTSGGTVYSTLADVFDLAFDALGNLYATNPNAPSNTIYQITPIGAAPHAAEPFITGISGNPFGLAFDSNQYLYASIHDNNVILRYTNAILSSAFTTTGTAVLGTDYSLTTPSPLFLPYKFTNTNLTGTFLGGASAGQTAIFTLTGSSNTSPGEINTNTLTFTSSVICVHPDMLVKTNSGMKKMDEIVARDIVYGKEGNPIEVIYNIKSGTTKDFYLFPKNCFGQNTPNSDFYIHGAHPIWYDNKETLPRNLIGQINGVKKVTLNKPVNVYSLCCKERTVFQIAGNLLVYTWSQEEWNRISNARNYIYWRQ